MIVSEQHSATVALHVSKIHVCKDAKGKAFMDRFCGLPVEADVHHVHQ